MHTVGIVGAGAAAAALSDVLTKSDRAVDITVLEKSGGVCGRAATRRRDGIRYDYGANYLKDDDERVTSLITDDLDDAGLVDVAEPVWTFDAAGTIEEGREDDERKWSYEAGLTQVAKRLFGRTDATVHRRTRVARIEREDDRWLLTDDDGERWGPFDVLVLNPPAPQTAALLEPTDVEDDLVAAVDAVPYRSVWTAVFHYPFELDYPYYGLVNVDKAHDIGWVSREECKPGHVPDGESLLIVQANGEWTVEHRDRDPETNLDALCEATADLIGDDRLREPDWRDHQHWRYALPEAGVDREPLRRVEADGLYCVGDWVDGEARLHAALRNGLETGDRLVETLSSG